MNSKTQFSNVIKFGLCIAFYVIAVAAYAALAYKEHKAILMKELDKQLMMSAKSLKYMLAPDFHDRAIDKDSISRKEEMKNRAVISGFASESGFKWVYTLAEKDGGFYFSAPTVTAQEAQERDKWYFYPYDEVPDEFRRAYTERKVVFAQYSDQWGSYRSIALPQISPGGHTYLACADADITYVKGLLQKNMLQSVVIAFFFLLCSVPFILLFRGIFRSHSAELQVINTELLQHKTNLEGLVRMRTTELETEKKNLEEALGRVKLLSGLVPICASCKKIRDDKGFWNQIELYIEDHSEAMFSHGICPECMQKLYPGH